MTQGLNDTLIGESVHDGFVITRRLGEGGMGAVYLAENAMLGTKLAVKVLLPEYANRPALLQRFVQEARAASAVPHPNIITITGFDQLPDGRHYFKMEYVEGRDLRGYCAYCMQQYGDLPLDRALEILAQVAAALIEVHRKHIVHRDLKPENIMVAPTADSLVHVKLLDFGIAKLSDAGIPNAIKTAVPVRMGTPGYWSPEQARGDEVDYRSDIFAVGVIAYEMMTGILPRTTQVDPRETERGRRLPEPWARTIMSAMALDPAQRPRTMREFILPLIEATPIGQELAARAASSLFRQATADDMTMRHPGEVPVVGAARLPPPSTTTMGGAAGEARSQAPVRSSRPWLVGVAVVAALGVGGALLALRSTGSERGDQTASAAPGPALVTADATPAVVQPPAARAIELTVTSEPDGAAVFVGDEAEPRGPAPVKLELTPGSEIMLRGTLDGHNDAILKLSAPPTDQSVALVLSPVPQPSARDRERRVPRAADKSKPRPEKRAESEADSMFPTDGVGGLE